MLMAALKEGKLCVVDVSQMSSEQALVLSGLILRRIFDHNQEQFTAAEPETIPTIAVVEEAQAVLNEKAAAAQPYITWVKEGRKYDLGAVLVTQQPGSIPKEILSQGDNWFLFHLLSAGDLKNVSAANAHFGEDILASLLNEPIPGQGVFWSSAASRQYPVPLRVRSFETQHALRDPNFDRAADDTYAQRLRAKMRSITETGRAPSVDPDHSDQQQDTEPTAPDQPESPAADSDAADGVDVLETIQASAIEEFRSSQLCERIRADGAPWGGIKAFFLERLPQHLHDADRFAFDLVRPALDEAFGEKGWQSYKHETNNTTWVRAVDTP